MVSHAILGATLAYVNGGNPAAGGTAADKLVRQGVNPSTIQFTIAVRPRDVWKKTEIKQNAIVETCTNCKGVWPKGTK